MWLYKKIIAVLIVLLLAACGFHPAYQSKDTSGNTILQKKLAAIEVAPIAGRMGQEMKNSLEDEFRPSAASIPAKYRLTVGMQKAVIPAAIEKDRRITRYNIVLTIPYTLTLIENGTVIDHDTLRVVGSYDSLDSRFSTFVAEDKTTNNTIHEAAKELAVRLGAGVIKDK